MARPLSTEQERRLRSVFGMMAVMRPDLAAQPSMWSLLRFSAWLMREQLRNRWRAAPDAKWLWLWLMVWSGGVLLLLLLLAVRGIASGAG